MGNLVNRADIMGAEGHRPLSPLYINRLVSIYWLNMNELSLRVCFRPK